MATIQGVYVALFGRPADPIGLNFFNTATKNGADLTAIGDLASTQEYKDRFAGQSNVQIVNSIYQSLFNRDADVAGLNFFVNGLITGQFKINDIAIRILDGATSNPDKAIVDTKIAAANSFTAALDTTAEIVAYTGNGAAAQGRAFLAPITTTAPTAAQVDAAVAAVVATPGGGGSNFALTNSIDVLVGTGANDTFIAGTQAGLATLTAGDSINGGEGTDTLRIFGNGNAGVFAGSSIVSIENVEVQLADTGAINVSGNAGVKTATVIAGSSGGNTVTLTKAQTAGIQGNSNPAGAGDAITFIFSDASAATNDVANLALNAAATEGVTAANIETLNIAATGASNIGTLTATSATTLNLTGTGSVTATTGTGALKTIDASALGAGFNLNIAGATATDLAVKGSAANDTLTTLYATLNNADSIDLGAGTNDTLLFTDTATFNDAATVGRLSKVLGVEEIGTVSAALTVDGDLLSQTRFSTSGTGSIAATNVKQSSTLEFGVGTIGASTAALKLGTNTLNIELQGGAGGAANAAAGLTVTGSSTINVLSTGTAGQPNNALTLTVADNQAVVLTGSQNTTLTVGNAGGVTGVSIDASAFTGNATITSGGNADILKGGSGNDILIGGNGADTFTGGAGADEFRIAITSAGTTAAQFSAAADTITDFVTKTDKLEFGAAAGTGTNFTKAAAVAADFASALAAADTALNGTVLYNVQQVGSDVYVFYDADGTLDTAGTQIVKLTGVALAGIEAADII